MHQKIDIPAGEISTPRVHMLHTQLQEEFMAELMSRRSAVALGLTTAVAAPLWASAMPARAAGAPNYGPNDGRELSPGRRLVEIGEIPSEMDAYKSVKVVDVVYQPGAADPTEAVMNVDMMCYILAGEFSIKKAGKEPYTVKALHRQGRRLLHLWERQDRQGHQHR
jgi:hypothetical protein